MRRYLVLFLVLLLSVFLLGVRLTILHVNDTHGHAWTFDEYQNPGIGGLAAIATIVEEVKREVEEQGGYVIFLHAGDLNTGFLNPTFRMRYRTSWATT